MFNDLNPQFPYYFCLFALTILLRLTRAYRYRPSTDATPAEVSEYAPNYFSFGFELVNVSAGVFILLSEKATKYVATFMIAYVILVILSIFLEEDRITKPLKIWGNIVITGVVVAFTCYAFLGVDALKSDEGGSAHGEPNWKVSLPYVDATLNRNFAVKSDPLLSSYVVQVSASNRTQAIAHAKYSFFGEKGPKPFAVKSEKSKFTMMIVEEDITAEHITKP
jgi:hypothetical protein